MNITKEKVEEWFLRNRPNYELNLKGHITLISDCINDLAPKWVSVDKVNPEDESVFYWVKLENGYIELMRLNKYTAIGGRKDYWQDLSGNDFDMKGSHFIEVTPPK